MKAAVEAQKDKNALKTRKMTHLLMVMSQRLQYQRRHDNAILYPNRYCSSIIDVADQSFFGLFHFVTNTLYMRGKAMKVRFVWLLEHLKPNILHSFILTKEQDTGANHIFGKLHRFVSDLASCICMPHRLYTQIDNFTREKMNLYLFANIESLLAWNVFRNIEVSFLPIFHAHENIDQASSNTSERLKSADYVTLLDFHSEVRTTYWDEAQDIHMKFIANWSVLCNKSPMLKLVRTFSPFCHFFTPLRIYESRNDGILVSCKAKIIAEMIGIHTDPRPLMIMLIFSSTLPENSDSFLQKLRSHPEHWTRKNVWSQKKGEWKTEAKCSPYLNFG